MSGNKHKIAIIGPYPPPYGGISVHIARIMTYLPEQSFNLYNISKESNKGRKFYGIWKYIYLISFLFKPYRVIHYHSTSKKVRLFLSIISIFKSNVFLHLHGESFTHLINKKGFTPWLIKKLIPRTNFIASNEDIFNIINDLKPKSLHIYDAFIPPCYDQKKYDSFDPGNIMPDSKYIISMVGWFANNENEDLYGFDIALEALHLLREQHMIDISIVASVNGVNDHLLYDQFLATQKKLTLDSNFILFEENLEEVYPLYLKSHIFIRPTNTDGNSVSIKEALWYGTPVIASDCVVRPEGISLFNNRDPNDLAEKILHIINEGELLEFDEKLDYCKSREFNYPLIKEIYGLEQ